jgi:hypothetical protein
MDDLTNIVIKIDFEKVAQVRVEYIDISALSIIDFKSKDHILDFDKVVERLVERVQCLFSSVPKRANFKYIIEAIDMDIEDNDTTLKEQLKFDKEKGYTPKQMNMISSISCIVLLILAISAMNIETEETTIKRLSTVINNLELFTSEFHYVVAQLCSFGTFIKNNDNNDIDDNDNNNDDDNSPKDSRKRNNDSSEKTNSKKAKNK